MNSDELAGLLHDDEQLAHLQRLLSLVMALHREIDRVISLPMLSSIDVRPIRMARNLIEELADQVEQAAEALNIAKAQAPIECETYRRSKLH
jgi:hypothetical protein